MSVNDFHVFKRIRSSSFPFNIKKKSINVNEVDWHVKASPLAMTKAELTDLMACAAVPVTAITDKPRAALSLVLCRNT